MLYTMVCMRLFLYTNVMCKKFSVICTHAVQRMNVIYNDLVSSDFNYYYYCFDYFQPPYSI